MGLVFMGGAVVFFVGLGVVNFRKYGRDVGLFFVFCFRWVWRLLRIDGIRCIEVILRASRVGG